MQTEMGLLAKKIGMTQLFREDGTRVPVTVLSCGGNVVTAHRTVERDGYTALQLAFDEVKPTRMNKPDLGQFNKAEVEPKRFVKELRLPDAEIAGYETGSEVKVDVFAEGQFVDVTGTSKGKGHAGVMKRHNMGGGRASHGAAFFHRHGGSIGNREWPGYVFVNKRMSGHMGDERVTTQNLKLVKIDAEKGLLFIEGSVPGANGGLVFVKDSIKRPRAK